MTELRYCLRIPFLSGSFLGRLTKSNSIVKVLSIEQFGELDTNATLFELVS
jgi:hypothetical protein